MWWTLVTQLCVRVQGQDDALIPAYRPSIRVGYPAARAATLRLFPEESAEKGQNTPPEQVHKGPHTSPDIMILCNQIAALLAC